MKELQNLLNQVTIKLETMKTARNLYGQKLATDFRVFDFFYIGEKELSLIIADLLNPQGSHSQKELFLSKFIQICLPEMQKQEYWKKGNFDKYLHYAIVRTEEENWANKNLRRLDIFLELKNDKNQHFGICIENKPYAVDQENQMADYATELELRYNENNHLVYLSEHSEPSSYSVAEDIINAWKANSRFSLVKFSDLIPWLQVCKGICSNGSVSEFLEQFIKFIQKEFMGVEDMNEEKELLDVVTSNQTNLISALKIGNTIHDIKKGLIKKLVDDLKEATINKEYKLLEPKLTGDNKCEKIMFDIGHPQIFINLEFDERMFHKPVLGVYVLNESLPQDDPLYIELNDILVKKLSNVKTGSHPYWVIWYWFEPNDWLYDTTAWEMIYSGHELSNKIIKEVDYLYDVLKQSNPLKLPTD